MAMKADPALPHTPRPPRSFEPFVLGTFCRTLQGPLALWSHLSGCQGLRFAALHGPLALSSHLSGCGQLSLLFPHIQKGLHKSGIERTLHNIHAHLELTHHIIKSPAVGIAVDFRAAYQTLDRGLIASAVLDTQALAPIWRAFHWAYSEHIRF